MGTLRIDWTLPTTREKGGALRPEDIEGVEISMSANNGTNWSSIGTFPASVLSTEVFDLDPGVYLVRGVVRDKLTPQGVSQPKVAPEVVVEDVSPPSPLETITVTVS